MKLVFNAYGQMVWDLSIAISWRLDKARPEYIGIKELPDKPPLQIVIENCTNIVLPKSTHNKIIEFSNQHGETDTTNLVLNIIEENILSALPPSYSFRDSLIELNLNEYYSAPDIEYEIIDNIAELVQEYREYIVADGTSLITAMEGILKKDLGHRITPRFDRLDTKLESIDKKLEIIDKNLNENMTEGFDKATQNYETLKKLIQGKNQKPDK